MFFQNIEDIYIYTYIASDTLKKKIFLQQI